MDVAPWCIKGMDWDSRTPNGTFTSQRAECVQNMYDIAQRKKNLEI